MTKYKELIKYNSQLQNHTLKYQYKELNKLNKKLEKEIQNFLNEVKNKRSMGSKIRVKEK